MNFFKIIKKSYVYLLAFTLPAAILFAVYIYMGIYPFGQKTLLTIDMTNEYVDYFSAFKSMFTDGGGVFYSFGKILGGNMTGLFAYYLASPLNVIFLFFDRANFDVAILTLTLLKIGLCGLTFAIYLNKTFKNPGLLTAVFSVFYALMAYNIIYQLNIMWLDGVICLPIVMLGIDRIIESKQPLLYYLSLTMAILTNYYIGYMICIFSLMYFIYKILLSEGYHAAFLKAKFFRGRFFNFIFTSVIAAGTSCFLILPAALSLQTGKEHFYLASLSLYPNYKFFGIVSKLALGSNSYLDAINGLPGIFCGLLVTLLLGLFFLNSLISVKEKIYSAVFIVIMLLNFYLNTFNKIWHGFNPPAWFPFRYSFVFSFLLIVLAYKAVINLHGARIRHIVLTCVVILGTLSLLAWVNFSDLSAKKLAITAVFVAVYCGVLIYAVRMKHFSRRLLALMLIPYVICEFAYNSYGMLENYSYASKAYYSAYVQQTGAAVDAVKAVDKGFYRMEKTFTRLNYNSQGNPTLNDSMMFDYNGLSHYSSTDDKKVNALMQSLGFKNNYNWAYYDRGSTVVANSLLGVKYILSQTPLDSSYQQINDSSGYYTYQNPYALPVAFMVNSNIRKINTNTQNPFDLQNKMLVAMLSEKQNECYSAIKLDGIALDNIRTVKNGSMTRYIKVDTTKSASIVFTFRSPGSGSDYAYFNTEKLRKVELSLNGQPFGTYFDTFDYGVLPLGNYQSGEEVSLKMTLSGQETDISQNEFYHLDLARYQNDYASLAKNSLTVTSASSTHISGKVTSSAGKQMLFTTIPYDEGWAVRIDGRQAVKHKMLDSLIGVYVPRGNHHIEFSYTPQGFTAGCVISVVSVFLALIYFYALYRRREVIYETE